VLLRDVCAWSPSRSRMWKVKPGNGDQLRYADRPVGRLEKETWSRIDIWPESLRRIEIEIAESVPHHSSVDFPVSTLSFPAKEFDRWVLHHLSSIHHVPLPQLRHFAVKRNVHSTAKLPFPPSVAVPLPHIGHTPELVPKELLTSLEVGGRALETLCLDWWDLSTGSLELVLKSVPKVRDLQLAVRESMLKLVRYFCLSSCMPLTWGRFQRTQLSPPYPTLRGCPSQVCPTTTSPRQALNPGLLPTTPKLTTRNSSRHYWPNDLRSQTRPCPTHGMLKGSSEGCPYWLPSRGTGEAVRASGGLPRRGRGWW
jgi:hypothetical protein